jgi:hypothetical protein
MKPPTMDEHIEENMSTTLKQNPTSTQKDGRPKFWSRIIITLPIFSFRAWFSARIVEESLLYNPRWKSGSKRKYWQSYDNSTPLNLLPVFLCWSRVLLESGRCRPLIGRFRSVAEALLNRFWSVYVAQNCHIDLVGNIGPKAQAPHF